MKNIFIALLCGAFIFPTPAAQAQGLPGGTAALTKITYSPVLEAGDTLRVSGWFGLEPIDFLVKDGGGTFTSDQYKLEVRPTPFTQLLGCPLRTRKGVFLFGDGFNEQHPVAANPWSGGWFLCTYAGGVEGDCRFQYGSQLTLLKGRK